jgi:mono/diheme cytochrome c family protein
MAGVETPLSGGFVWDIPPGRFLAPNITSDDETGLGRISDQAIARALRYGVGHDGRALLPFMEAQGLSDEDLTAVVSYLRSLPPVENRVPAHRYSLRGKIVKATLLAEPVGPKVKPPEVSPRGATIENGRYLTESVALCGACHTQRNPASGQYNGPPHGGATGMSEPDDPGHSWSPPNITSDPATGRLGSMSEDVFVARFRTGRALERSPMPWQGYSRMAGEDLRAIYRYLASLPPVKRDVGPPLVRSRGEGSPNYP